MSDTARTDDQIGHAGSTMSAIRIDFARQLERELNVANSEVYRLRKANLQLREGAEEQKQRIKRLEEAGDELLMWLGEDISESNGQLLQDAWNKAKEAKL